MMEMDSQDSVKCRKSKLRDIIGIIEISNDNRIKQGIVSSPIFKLRPKREKRKKRNYSEL